jgi:hypothetical protein
MAAVARETNLSDTGFATREELPDADFRSPWFRRGGRARPRLDLDLDLDSHIGRNGSAAPRSEAPRRLPGQGSSVSKRLVIV